MQKIITKMAQLKIHVREVEGAQRQKSVIKTEKNRVVTTKMISRFRGGTTTIQK